MTRTVKCPDCQANEPEDTVGCINIPIDAEPGEIIECPECGAEVEILSTNPIVVNLLEEEK
ncbi:lysine biosynthesis protein LysW [Candidatus Microgenomates bacterium]|jgi:NAD-dependent SIR2 family protein deacetylase|nr:MAG: lysine biosynthesis protein LysW [Candidatus Microgenomates bacterium]